MPLNYSHTTYAQAKSALSALLMDNQSNANSNVLGGAGFFTNAELGGYIQEALYWWGGATNFWRDRGTFNTNATTPTIPPTLTADNPWYDLPTFLPTLRGYNITDSQAVSQILLHFLEPTSGGQLFSTSDILSALQKRRDQFLLETMIGISHYPIVWPSPPIGRLALADNVIAIRRAAWKTAIGTWTVIPRSDEWYLLNYYQQGFPQTVTEVPEVYSVAVTPPLTVQLAPPPQGPGTLDLLAVESGATLTGAGVLLGIPDNFWWVVKWGAMADLLGRDGPAKDPGRASYCEKRWKEGIEVAKLGQSAMFVSINDTPAYLESLDSVDTGRILWQNYSGNPPFMAVMAGLNLMALVDPPAGSTNITVDCVQNAIVPSAEGDFLQVGREELAVILGYAKHLAVFKCGGAEFQATYPDLQRAFSLAITYNSKLKAATQPALTDRAQIEKSRRPAMIPQGVS